MATVSTEIKPRAERGGSAGLLWLGLAVFGAVAMLWEGILALFDAWQLAEYSHGPLIPILSGMMFLRQLKENPPQPGPLPDRWPGVVVIVFALMLGLLGNVARIPDITAYALIIWVGGVILVSFGWHHGKQYWPPVLHLVFMLPLPGLVYWKLSTTLQFISSEFGVFLVRLAGVPVFLDGNIIDLGVYKLHVAEACSGLRYLFPVMSFSYIFAVLYRGPMWHKAVLLISAAPITVVMNSVRIGVVGIIVDAYGIEHAEGLSHFMEGWVVFIACILILFGLARFMLMLQPVKMSLTEALDLDFSGFAAQFSRLKLVQPSAALIVATVIVCTAAVGWRFAPAVERPEIARAPLILFPREVGDWRTERLSELGPVIEAALGADDYYSSVMVNPDSEKAVDVFIAWYQDQTRGGIHSPEVCIPAGGWEMSEITRTDIGERVGVDTPFPINRAIIQKGLTRNLVFYWFEQSSGRYAWDYGAKAALIRSAITTGRTDGALVRLITPLDPQEDPVEAEERLLDIVRPMMDVLPRFVPD